MNFTRVCLLLMLNIFMGCEHVHNVAQALIRKAEAGRKKTVTVQPERTPKKKNGLVLSRRKDGSLLSEINFTNGKMHGIAKSYYPDGSIHFIYPYRNGLLHGELLWYYPNGKLYKKTPYIEGNLEGIEETYSQSGKLIGETPYKNNFPGIGLKEYISNGSIKKMPHIVVVTKDNMAKNGEYIVTVRMSDNSPHVKFYIGQLTDGKYMNDGLIGIYTSDGTGEKRYKVPAGFYSKEQLNFIALYTTPQGNKYVTQKAYTLEIHNN